MIKETEDQVEELDRYKGQILVGDKERMYF